MRPAFILFSLFALSFLGSCGGSTCGPDVTLWLAQQMDSARASADVTLASGGDLFVALLGDSSSSLAYGVRSAIGSETTCPDVTEPACVDDQGTGTVTLCGSCVTVNTTVLIAYGYASAPLSGTALYGAISQNSLSPPIEASVAVLMGVYLRSRYTETSLAADTSRMCSLLNGERFNIMPKMLFTGMCGDIYAQDALYSAVDSSAMTVTQWESENDASLCETVETLISLMKPETLGTWMSLVSVSDCSTCASVFTAPELLFSSGITRSPKVVSVQARDVKSACDAFSRTSSNWASCNRWSFVVHSTVTTTPAVSPIVRTVEGECLAAQLAFKGILDEMVAAESICAPYLLEEFTSQLEVILDLCACPSFADIARPLLSFGQVLCNSQAVYTNVTGEQCFRTLIVNIVDIPRLDLVVLPVCVPCASEILARENMGLAYDMMCQFQNKYWPSTGLDSNCLGVFNESLGVVPSVPSECLVPLTSSGDIVAGWESAELPSYCQDIYKGLEDTLFCCCHVYNDILEIRGYRAGLDGLVCPPCSTAEYKIKVGVVGLDWDSAIGAVGEAAVLQMAKDEVAHRLPVISRPDFIKDVSISQASSGEKRENIDASIELTYQAIYDDAAIDIYDQIVEGDSLVEMTDFISNATVSDADIQISFVEISCDTAAVCPSESLSVSPQPSVGSKYHTSFLFLVISLLALLLLH
ncbi:hypothetical protein Pelo_7468 [Pelomyxa schiedti]|nr:hypothetical protein Pelo_7468 [Pelomyxa schiedti]